MFHSRKQFMQLVITSSVSGIDLSRRTPEQSAPEELSGFTIWLLKSFSLNSVLLKDCRSLRIVDRLSL